MIACMKNEKGVSLVEVLLVLFILTIIMSIVIPNFWSMSEHYLMEGWIQQFIITYYWSQQQAIYQDQWVEIILYPSLNLYVVKNGEGILKKITYNKGIRITNTLNNNRIRFNANGNLALQNGTITIKTKNKVRQIVIQMYTGQIYAT